MPWEGLGIDSELEDQTVVAVRIMTDGMENSNTKVTGWGTDMSIFQIVEVNHWRTPGELILISYAQQDPDEGR